jgi:hypothetical protein
MNHLSGLPDAICGAFFHFESRLCAFLTVSCFLNQLIRFVF